jgi:hypothetical protein
MNGENMTTSALIEKRKNHTRSTNRALKEKKAYGDIIRAVAARKKGKKKRNKRNIGSARKAIGKITSFFEDAPSQRITKKKA